MNEKDIDVLSLSLGLITQTRLLEIFFERRWFENIVVMTDFITDPHCQLQIKSQLVHF